MTYCSNCGSAVEGKFCPKCGTPAGDAPAGTSTAPPTAAPVATAGGLTDNVAAALCYVLGLITGILFLVLEPYNQKKNIRFHAFQAIFFNVGAFVVWIVFFIVSMVLHIIPIIGTIISILLAFGVWIGLLIVWLMLMYKAYNNDKFVLPIIGPLAEKQA